MQTWDELDFRGRMKEEVRIPPLNLDVNIISKAVTAIKPSNVSWSQQQQSQ